MRRFEFHAGASNKFWEIASEDESLVIRWGRVGGAGQSQTKTFPRASDAQVALQELVASKTAKGYVEVGRSKPDKAPRAPKASGVAKWERIRRRLGVPEKRGARLVAALERAERKLGLLLPPSYRDFVEHLGLGCLANTYVVWTPALLVERAIPTRSIIWGRLEVDNCSLNEPQLRRIIPMGRSYNGDDLAWLPPATPGARHVEWPILLISRSFEVTRAAPDLSSFITRRCLGLVSRDAAEAEGAAPAPPFEPLTVSEVGRAEVPSSKATRAADEYVREEFARRQQT